MKTRLEQLRAIEHLYLIDTSKDLPKERVFDVQFNNLYQELKQAIEECVASEERVK